MGSGSSHPTETLAKCEIQLYFWFGGNGGVGHLSLLVDNSFYVSFWPETNASMLGSVPSSTNTFKQDCKLEGRDPDKVIRERLEMDKSLMAKCWADIKHENYSFSTNNCIDAVLNVLAAGNGAFYLSPRDFPRRRKPKREWTNSDYCTQIHVQIEEFRDKCLKVAKCIKIRTKS